MYDKKLIVEILQNIAWSLDQIVKRFQTIEDNVPEIVEVGSDID